MSCDVREKGRNLGVGAILQVVFHRMKIFSDGFAR
jgi:hypothetical protein